MCVHDDIVTTVIVLRTRRVRVIICLLAVYVLVVLHIIYVGTALV